MKRDKIDMVILSVISSFMIAGCQVESSSGTLKTQEPMATETGAKAEESEVEELMITKDILKDYVKEHEDEYGEIIYDLKDDEILIEKKECNNEELYFFLYTPVDGWYTTLYQIREVDGDIQSLDYVSEGATDYFNFDVISISEGEFVTVYSATHMGNGYLTLVDLEKIPDRQNVTMPDYELYAIDGYYED
ncbi:MAG: hypothetical protein IKL07_05480, partial [Clostridium sp.]|nr:hypothetical protein [Clostridium sp.]